ncbi:MAG: FkbM family methyltransferase [Bacteroidota bacterium]
MQNKLFKSMVESTWLEYPARSILKSFTSNPSVVTNQSIIMIFIRTIKAQSNCIDIGASKGSIFKHMIRLAPKGTHYAFEPVPYSFAELQKKFSGFKNIHLKQMALSNVDGMTKFNFVKSHPGYSGIRSTGFPKNKETVEIDVELRKLDSVLPADYRPDVIKIDVEGNELFVFEGAYETLKKNNPVIVFEHDKGLCDAYGVDCSQVYDILVKKLNYKLYNLQSFTGNRHPLSEDELKKCFYEGSAHDYVACK